MFVFMSGTWKNCLFFIYSFPEMHVDVWTIWLYKENIEVIFYVNSFGENSFVKYQYLTTFLINFMFK